MTDGLATALIVIVAILACIAGGVAWWVHRPLHNAHDPVSRVQPLFGGDGVRFADAEDDGSYEDDDYDDELDSEDEPARDAPAARDSSVPDSAGPVRSHRPTDSPGHPSSLSAPTPPARDPVEYAGARTFATAVNASAGAESAASSASARAGTPGRNPASADHAHAHGDATDAQRFSKPPAKPSQVPAPVPVPVSAAKGAAHATRAVAPGTVPPAPQAATVSAAQHGAASGVQPATAPVTSRAAAPVVPVANTAFTSPAAWNGGNSVQFTIPTDGTLQFLPGRLELIAGTDTGREIRFVRLPDAATPEITFGRTAGTPYRHIQLLDGTVSRMHASMRLDSGRWSLTNRSTTNPVVYNGEVLGEGETRALDDGDRIEMGELAFRFRSR